MMDLSNISLCYYPTATIIIDDEINLLEFIVKRLFKDHNFACQPFHNPITALNFLIEEYQNKILINYEIETDQDKTSMINITTNFDITAIHKQIYNPKRFSLITNAIVDFAMPEMTGDKFCQQIKNPFIKKIMLTGKASNDTGIELFNEENIDKFIVKTDPEKLMTSLPHIINNLKYQSFLECSEKILSQLNNSTSNSLFTSLSDPAFTEIFNEKYKKHNAVEFYILDNQGSFLFLDKQAKPSWLIIATEETMEGYYQIAKQGESTSSIVNALKNRTKIPFFPSAANQEQTLKTMAEFHPSNWEKYLYSCKTFEGKTKYYYAYLSELRVSDIQFDKITSYQSYMDEFFEKHIQNL